MKVIRIEISYSFILMLLAIMMGSTVSRLLAAAETRQDTLVSPAKTINEDTQELRSKPDKTDHGKLKCHPGWMA
ncbi:MAG: hypothetical protein RI993_2188 [Pseudomonadota bacterium]|jgi:hypothetical protein